MADLAEFRTRLDALLATAVDAATWPDGLKDEALLRGLWDYDAALIYETSLTLSVDGHAQDVGTIHALDDVLAVAWPWRDGDCFSGLAVRWRWAGDHLLYLETHARPQAGDVLRLRHTCRHTILGLDGALTTSVPQRHTLLVSLAAALWAIDLRLRQISENPALPQQSGPLLQALRRELHDRYESHLGRLLNRNAIRWDLVAS